MRKFLSMLLAIALALGVCAAAEENQSGSPDFSGHVVILHTNDSHGRVSGGLGFSKVSFARQKLEAAGATVLVVDAGDTLYGLPFATVFRGESPLRLMAAAGYDAMTPGCHDFHYGAERLSELKEAAGFPVLSANALKADGEMLLPANTILEKDNVKFGIFGLSSPDTGRNTAPGETEGLSFADPVETARAQVAALEAEDCTVIIALAHLDAAAARQVAEQVTGIDVMIGGCAHEALESGEWVNGTLIVNGGAYIDNIGCVDIDQQGRASATLLTAEDFGQYDTDAAIDEMIGQIIAAQDQTLGAAIGRTETALDGAHEAVCAGETNLGNLAADAFRAATGADAALIPGSAIRDSIAAGDITGRQLSAVFPDGGYIVTAQLTGERLLMLLENGVSRYPEADGRFPQVSGVTFKLDGAAEAGSRVFDVTVGGEALDPAKTYLVALSDGMVAGNDGYSLEDAQIVHEYGAMRELLAEYLSGSPTAEGGEGRIVVQAKPAA